MIDHSGTARVRYEDAFRAVGNYLDQHRFSQIVLVETPQGFLIKGQIVADVRMSEEHYSYPETYLFSNEDIDNLLESAYERRRNPE